MMSQQQVNKVSEKACCQKEHLIVTQEGSIVCTSCGTVHGEEIVANEVRAYTAEEVKKRKQTEPVYKKYGARTVLKHLSKDAKGNVLGMDKRRRYHRLGKINRSLVTSIDRNFMEAMPRMLFISKKLDLPNYVFETSWMIYMRAAKKKLTMGRAIEDFVCASLYVAIRVHELPRILIDIKDVATVTHRAIHKALGLIVREVLPELNLKYTHVGSKELIYRFGSELSINMETQLKALKILKYAKRRGLRITGKDPKGLAGAVLYIAGKIDHNKKTQKEISRVSKITEVTLRNRIKQIERFLKN